ncbi:MAG: hypothetical protein EOS33_27255 [Mesorhizobium sp.]|nr:MAG: hypothetical protein EOS33_27255 [Mesorhizobium sp.]
MAKIDRKSTFVRWRATPAEKRAIEAVSAVTGLSMSRLLRTATGAMITALMREGGDDPMLDRLVAIQQSMSREEM